MGKVADTKMEKKTTCKFNKVSAKSKALRIFLTKYGDDLPPEVIQKAASPSQLKHWALACENDTEIVSVARWETADWYLCTLKNAATRPDKRGKGYGSKVYTDAVHKALDHPECLVMTADVTYDNTPSKKILKKLGFKPVNKFCWDSRAKPADIMHYVRAIPKNNKCDI